MTPEKKSRDDCSTLKTPLKVKFVDNKVLYAYGKCDLHLTELNVNDKNCLKLCAFRPKTSTTTKKNSFFPSLTKKGVAVKFKGKACRVNNDGKQYTIDHKHSKLCKLYTTILDETCCIGKTNNQKPLELLHQ